MITHNYSADFIGFVLNLKRKYLVLMSKSFNISTQITISKLDVTAVTAVTISKLDFSVDVTAALLSSGDNNSCLDVTITVRDEGSGIPRRLHKQLFDCDPMVRPEQLQQNQGSGIGLPLCKRIVTMHGGSIVNDSSEGEGCTMSFTIPFQLYRPRSPRISPFDHIAPIQESQVSIASLLEERSESGYLHSEERELLLTDSFLISKVVDGKYSFLTS